MFEGFAQSTIETGRGEITLVHGSGPSPALAERFTVVTPDLRGYRDSSKPPGGPDNFDYSERAVAGDQMEMMAALGFDRFAVVGHDRQQVTGRALACGHFLAEELPDDTVSELLSLLA
jgi:pimeloyl-ACP methyl ester carboxylesterase